MNNELMEKVKSLKEALTADDLVSLATSKGVELTSEEAATVLEMLSKPQGGPGGPGGHGPGGHGPGGPGMGGPGGQRPDDAPAKPEEKEETSEETTTVEEAV